MTPALWFLCGITALSPFTAIARIGKLYTISPLRWTWSMLVSALCCVLTWQVAVGAGNTGGWLVLYYAITFYGVVEMTKNTVTGKPQTMTEAEVAVTAIVAVGLILLYLAIGRVI